MGTRKPRAVEDHPGRDAVKRGQSSFPQLRPHLTVASIDSSRAVLLSDVESWPLEGPIFPRLAPLLDGTRSVMDIVQELRGSASVAEVLASLAILHRSGHLVDGRRRTREGTRNAANAATIDVLDKLGLGPRRNGDVEVVLTDEYLRRDVSDFAKKAARANRAWLPVKPMGTVIWVGPLVHPPSTPCWDCVLARIRANRPAHTWLESSGGLASDPVDLKTLRIRHNQLRAPSNTLLQPLTRIGTMIALDPRLWRSSAHLVVPQPGCPRCAPPVASSEGGTSLPDPRIVLTRRPRAAFSDGGWRAVPPHKTFSRYRHHISRWTGIITRITRRTTASRGLELYSAEHVFLASETEPFPTGRRLSSGKGIGRAQARASALCEALERYSGIFRGIETRVRTSYDALGGQAIHPNACAAFSELQFEERDAWNARALPQCWVPRLLDRQQEIDWTPVWSLSHDTIRYVPTAYCYFGYRAPEAERCSRANSNGCAAGNSLEEAILQGFLELVERDAVAIWWYNELARPTVDLATFSNPFFRRMVRDYARNGRSLTVHDLTTDLGIPVFAAVSEGLQRGTGELLLGFGAHLDASTAIARAITELNQWRSGVHLGVAGPSFSHRRSGLGRFLRRTRQTAVRDRRNFQDAIYTDIRDAVMACVTAAHRCGMETLVLDQTRKDVGLPVVRVIVPGLRHFWPRFAPGRLYDVPVALGWRRTSRTEGQMNNFHIVI